MPRRKQPEGVTQRVVRRATRGDSDALALVWRDLHPLLLRFLRSLGARDVEDIASQVWVEVARGLRDFEGDRDALKGLLFTIARRRMIDGLRQASRRDEALVEHVPERATPGDVFETALGIANAQALLRTLPAAQAEVVALRVIGGFSARETAQITGQSEGAVRVMMTRALATLREHLELLSARYPEIENSFSSDVTNSGAVAMDAL